MKDGFLRNLLNFYIPSIFSFILGLVSAIVLTRIFSPDNYGMLNIFNNTVALMLSISYLGLDSAFMRFYNEPPEGLSSKQLGYSLLSISLRILGVFSFLVILFWSEIFTYSIFGFKSRMVCMAIFLSVISQLIIRYFLITYRMQFKTKKYSIITILSQIATKFFVVIAALFTNNIIGILLVNALGIVLMVVVMLFLYQKDVFPQARKISVLKHKEVFRFALFSAPIPIIINLNAFISQRIILAKLDMDALGIYSSANYFNSIFAVLQSGFATFCGAYIYSNYKENQEKISRVHDVIMYCVILIYGIFILFKDIIYWIIGTEYHESKTFFAMVVFYPIMTLLSETTCYGIQIKKKNYLLLVIYVIVLITNGFFAWFLTDRIGLKGAACASALAGIAFYIFSTLFGQKYYRTINNKLKSTCGFCILIGMMICAEVMHDVNIIIMELFFILCASGLYMKEIKYIFKILLSYVSGEKTKKIHHG